MGEKYGTVFSEKPPITYSNFNIYLFIRYNTTIT